MQETATFGAWPKGSWSTLKLFVTVGWVIHHAKVLVCLEGPARRLGRHTSSVLQHVVKPLAADIVAVAPRSPGIKEEDVASAISEYFEGAALATRSEPDMSAESMRNELARKLGPWAQHRFLLDNKNSTSPTAKLWQMYAQAECLVLLRAAERQHGRLYQWMVYLRNDMLWLADHPSLTLLDPTHVWLFDNHDWAGVNDRYAAVPRKCFSAYFDMWWRIVDGQAIDSIGAAFGRTMFSVNGEILTSLLLDGVSIGRIPPLAVRLCREQRGESIGTIFAQACRPGAIKSIPELLDAFGVSSRLAAGWKYIRGARWRGIPTHWGRYFTPYGCFFGNRSATRCCDSTAAIGAALERQCWGRPDARNSLLQPGILPLSRLACCGFSPLVAIAPASTTLDEPCWPVDDLGNEILLSCAAGDPSAAGQTQPPAMSMFAVSTIYKSRLAMASARREATSLLESLGFASVPNVTSIWWQLS